MTLRTLSGAGVVLATLLLVAANTAAGSSNWLVATLVIGGAWLALRKRLPNIVGICFAALVVVATKGTIEGHPFSWMVAAVVAALVAWDLDHLSTVAETVERTDNRHTLEGIHLRRLVTVVASGAFLAVVARSVDLRFGLIAAVALSLVTLLGLRSIVRSARKGG